MTTDLELLKSAATAIFLDYIECGRLNGTGDLIARETGKIWNPLTDDGDALRLAVRLKIDINFDFDRIDVGCVDKNVHAVEYIYDKPTPTDTYSATRRAIVRAAAEIEKQRG